MVVWTVNEYKGRQMVQQWLNFCLVYRVRIVCQYVVRVTFASSSLPVNLCLQLHNIHLSAFPTVL